MTAQGRIIDQVLLYLLLQLKVEREQRLRKMYKCFPRKTFITSASFPALGKFS